MSKATKPDSLNPSDPLSSASRRTGQPSQWVARAQLAVWPVIFGLIVVGCIVSPAFGTQRNFVNVLQQASVLAVLTLAMLLVVLVRKFDLSIESMVAFSPMVAAGVSVAVPAGSGTSLPGWCGS